MLVAASSEESSKIGSLVKGDGLTAPVLDAALSYTLADFSHYYRALSGGRQMTDSLVWCAVAIAFLLYVVVDACLGSHWGAAAVFAGFMLPFVYWAALPFVIPRRLFNRWRKATQSSPYRLIVSEAGVRILMAHAEGAMNWSYFTFGWEDEKMLVFSNLDQAAYMIPRRLLQNAEPEARLRDLLIQQLPVWIDVRTMPTGYLRRWMKKARKEAKNESKRAT